ncbi:MAG: ankyrin repeat domain-containing protein [Alphaproteobacteria bacterium]|nr:ankyrin repeat domain-containing protein [Alphaproteobacteria bacterium]
MFVNSDDFEKKIISQNSFRNFVSLIPSKVSFSNSARPDIKDMSLFKENYANGSIKNLNTIDAFGWTFLHYAAVRNNSEAIDFLVKHGANMEIKTNDGQTPLYLATIMENIDAVQTLVNLGANIDTRDDSGDHLLYIVKHKHNQKLAEVLKLEEMKAKINFEENPKFEKWYEQKIMGLIKSSNFRD